MERSQEFVGPPSLAQILADIPPDWIPWQPWDPDLWPGQFPDELDEAHEPEPTVPMETPGTPLGQRQRAAGEAEPFIAVPEEALVGPLDPEFANIGLSIPTPDPFFSEADRKWRCAQEISRAPLPLPDVAFIRRRLRLTQAQFARLLGFPVGTLRHWERGDRYPRRAALVLLNVIARNPRAVLQAVARYRQWLQMQATATWKPRP